MHFDDQKLIEKYNQFIVKPKNLKKDIDVTYAEIEERLKFKIFLHPHTFNLYIEKDIA